MIKRLSYLILIAVLALGGYSLSTASPAKSRAAAPARVHFSGNLEGELEPCG